MTYDRPLPGISAGRLGQTGIKSQTVDELSDRIKAALAAAPELSKVAVRGELQNFKRHSSGHAYFTLVGKQSRISAVLFRSYASGVLDWPEDGDEVMVTGSVDLYPKAGVYQLYATRILPIGHGAQSRAKEELRAKLEREGLFDIRRKRPLPRYPSKVAIITSPTGAALQDILKVSENRSPFVDIVIIPATVQGVEAPAQVSRALALAGRLRGVQCVVLARGGGAKDDLSPFDDERLVRAVRGCPLPVVTGVGHQTDSSLADLAADASLPTPSAAAERIFPDCGEIRGILSHELDALISGVTRTHESFSNLLARRRERLTRFACSRIAETEKLLETASRVMSISIKGIIQTNEETIASHATALNALSPLAVLGRGYAICRDSGGAALRSVKTIKPGDLLSIQLNDGDIDARAVNIQRRESFELSRLPDE